MCKTKLLILCAVRKNRNVSAGDDGEEEDFYEDGDDEEEGVQAGVDAENVAADATELNLGDDASPRSPTPGAAPISAPLPSATSSSAQLGAEDPPEKNFSKMRWNRTSLALHASGSLSSSEFAEPHVLIRGLGLKSSSTASSSSLATIPVVELNQVIACVPT